MAVYQADDLSRSSIKTLDDKALMLRFQSTGDAELMTALFERHKDGLKMFLIRLAGNPDTAEDISQRTWVKLLEVAERQGYSASNTATFKTYLFTMARNTYLDDYRRMENRVPRVDVSAAQDIEDTDQAEPVELLTKQHDHANIRTALSQLPQEQREVLAFWAADISYADIAEITGASRDTVIGRKRYGVARLKKLIGLPAQEPTA